MEMLSDININTTPPTLVGNFVVFHKQIERFMWGILLAEVSSNPPPLFIAKGNGHFFDDNKHPCKYFHK